MFSLLLHGFAMFSQVEFDAGKLKNLSHLVLVAGHAVVMADSLEHVLHRESEGLFSPGFMPRSSSKRPWEVQRCRDLDLK